ncbi:UNVERIFIED_CONTAM: hypothetical protein HDU68_007797 [Siphonaria sp. JEL0065]|nr:hypothetical protein HDU68_007797 [Siphonaria sp. JEL0065]
MISSSTNSSANQSKTFIKDGKTTIIHTLLTEGTTEQTEELDTKTNLLPTRKLRKKPSLDKKGPGSMNGGGRFKFRVVKQLEGICIRHSELYRLDVYNVTVEGDKIVEQVLLNSIAF